MVLLYQAKEEMLNLLLESSKVEVEEKALSDNNERRRVMMMVAF